MEDLHKIWQHRWLTKKAESRFSQLHGFGVFAKEKIVKGESVGVLGGVIVPLGEIHKYRSVMTQVGIQVDNNFFIVPTNRQELELYGVFNHSCEPNIGFSNSITLVAIKNIVVGEELVFDYAFSETFYDGFTCSCGMNTCRKQINANDWRIKSIQEKYGEYFSPYIKNKIKLKEAKLNL